MLSQLSLSHWSMVLIALHHIRKPHRYTQRLYREVPNSSPAHIRKILSLMETGGFITRTEGSKIKHIEFTPKGEQIAEDVLKLKQDMERDVSFFEKK
ncbi:MAG: hypothetical protein WC614_07080 [bacterium]